jgi:PleD family two-component response regulator
MEEQEFTAPVQEGKTRIVVVGKHEYILENTERLLQKEGFETVGFTFLAEALDYIRMNPIEGVLIGGGVDPHDRLQVSELVKTTLPHVKLIEHFGGPATIVSEVKAALAQ